jgi:N6-L-threonylcarbamoyladenine synthase
LGKAIALARSLPLIAVNHLEAHALTPGLCHGVTPPYLLLLVSGGHTQLLAVRDVGRYERLGSTIDDALGEAFDKTAKLLGLGYPGGPEVEKRARAAAGTGGIVLPRPMLGRAEPNFSFAGLKTAVRHEVERLRPLTEETVGQLARAFEEAVAEVVADRVERAADLYLRCQTPWPVEAKVSDTQAQPILVVAGGVAANARLRASLDETAIRLGFRLLTPPLALCTDNAAIVAWAGAERLARGMTATLDFAARPRWPLDATAEPLLGAGRHGAKA